MLTFETLRRQPHRFAELRGCDVLIGTADAREVVIQPTAPARGDPSPTLVFNHETIALMKAERAGQIDKLKGVIHGDSVVIPLMKKPSSFWDHITVGRASTADIVLEDPAVSNVHAHFVLHLDEHPVRIQDVGSSNGTFVNREPLQPHTAHPLVNGDCLRLGQTVLYLVTNSVLEQLLDQLGRGAR
ncbi:MAG TPA: FHA domain-containing protein [Myxococcota bacterium]|nr:FHA domain-containing protein [Myxococcota bacterium]